MRNMRDKRFFNKLQKVLNKNEGLKIIYNINDLNEGSAEMHPSLEVYSLNEIVAFKYAPIVTCDVERNFSEFKALLRDNRRSITFENFKHHLVVKCNKIL